MHNRGNKITQKATKFHGHYRGTVRGSLGGMEKRNENPREN
jgi:hypothetical protein